MRVQGIGVAGLGRRPQVGNLLLQPPLCGLLEPQPGIRDDTLSLRLVPKEAVPCRPCRCDRRVRPGPALLPGAVAVADLVLAVPPDVDVAVEVAVNALAALRLRVAHEAVLLVGHAPGPRQRSRGRFVWTHRRLMIACFISNRSLSIRACHAEFHPSGNRLEAAPDLTHASRSDRL